MSEHGKTFWTNEVLFSSFLFFFFIALMYILMIFFDFLYFFLGIARIEFNTYVISILVIFFLQTNYEFPTVNQLMQQNSTICPKLFNMRIVLRNFFLFYGNHYKMLNHIISAHIGEWQDKRSLSEQRSGTTAQIR